MSHRIPSFLAALAVLIATPVVHAEAQEALATYDNFDAPLIDPVKWRGNESVSSPAMVVTESRRAIVADRLQLEMTVHGATGSNIGSTGEARNRLLVNHPGLIDGTPRISVMRSVITVIRALAENCAASDRSTRVYAGMFGFFFNDDSGSDLAGDFTGDVLALLELRRDSRTGNSIVATLARCTNSSCSSATILGSATFTRSWATRVPIISIIKWQPELNRFAFTATSGDLGTETKTVTYNLSDVKKSKAFGKDLRASASPANCVAGDVKASIDARFNDVQFNATAVEVTQ